MMYARTLAFCILVAFAMTATGRAQAPAKLRVATVPLENGAQVFFAKEQGFFVRAGLDVDVQSIQSGAAVSAAVIANAVDVGFASLVPLAIARTKSIPFVIIAPGAMWTPGAKNSALFVATGSAIRTAKDLNGKTLSAAGLGTLTEYAARAWIDQNGGDASTVKFVEMGYSVMPNALAAGRIDAALINEPYLGAARKGSRLLGYPYDAVAPEFLIGAWFATSAWASEHPDLVNRFAAAMRDAAVWANQRQNAAKTADILAQYVKLDPALAATMVHVRFAERLTAALIQPQIDVTAKYGSFATFPAQEIMYGGR